MGATSDDAETLAEIFFLSLVVILRFVI